MKKSRVSDIKREQKKSFLLQEISSLFRQIVTDETRLSFLFITRVELSGDGGICYVYFSTYAGLSGVTPAKSGEEMFKEGLQILKLYKPSMRKTLAQTMRSRYVPDLVFRYDKAKEKERKITSLLDKIAQEREDGEGHSKGEDDE